jgi:hypothetical protein
MLEEKLTEILKMLESGVMWTAEQVPLVVKELYIWKTWVNIIGVLGGLALMIIAYRIYVVVGKKVVIKTKANPNWYDGWLDEVAAVILIVFSSIFGVVIFIACLFEFLQIILAPRIWLIEYISSIVVN